MSKAPVPLSMRHGLNIFIYSNLRTNQVIYSLTREMKNNKALRQLPFLGKKTVPAALRKDLWQPLATISFPAPSQGLLAYQKLREFRRMHETLWPIDDFKDEKGMLLNKKKRGRKLMDQKANSIADIAAVLHGQEKLAASEAQEKLVEESIIGMVLPVEGGEATAASIEKEQAQKEKTVKNVTISWADMLDAEYAETWPKSVLHDGMDFRGRGRHVAPGPVDSQTEIYAHQESSG